MLTLSQTHIVHFDADEKITQVRLSWDQGTLLRQVDVIGSRGKNWPIVDGKDQIKLIVKSSDLAAEFAPAPPLSRGRFDESGDHTARPVSPSKKYIKDPHASLDLFSEPQSPENHRPESSTSDQVAPRDSAKPPPREYSEIFAAGHEDHLPSPGGSPGKVYRESYVAPKGAGARKFQNSNLFQDDQTYKEPKIYKTNPARYNHFDLGDPQEDDAFQHKPGMKKEHKDVPLMARTNKNQSQWGFEDFATPAKTTQRQRESDQVHFSLGNQNNGQNGAEKTAPPGKARKDAEPHFAFRDDGTPVKRMPAEPKARKDQQLHFEFRDEPSPEPRRLIGRTKAAIGLYRSPLEDDERVGGGENAPLTNITNTNRQKDLDSQWEGTDGLSEPANKSKTAAVRNRKGLDSSWDF